MSAESLGQYMARARRMREIGLDEITSVTKIRKDYLEAMEGDRFDVLPPRPFVVGFLKAYANYVGLDPDDLVTRYLDQVEQDKKDAARRLGEKGSSRGAGSVLGRILRCTGLF